MKKIFAVLLSAMMILGASPAFAEGDYTNDYADDTSLFDYIITVDGTEVNSEPGYDGYLYRYTSIADALGFQTSYQAETGTVLSTKDDITISFAANGSNYFGANFTQGGQTYSDYFYFENINDRIYIPYPSAEMLASSVNLTLTANESLEIVSIYTADGKQALKEQADARLTRMNEMLGLTKDKNYTAQGTGSMTVNLTSNLFGLSGAGTMNIETVSAKSGDKQYSKVTMSGSGLMNLFQYSGMENEDFSDSDTIEVFTDGKQVYFKNDKLAEALLSEEYYAFAYDYPEETESVLNKWVYTETVPSSFQLLLNNGASMGSFIVDYCFENASYATDPAAMIDMMVTLMSDETIAVTENNGKKTYTYKVDKSTFLNCLEQILPQMSDEERAEFDAVMEGFSIEVSAAETVSADGIISMSDGKISISNVPNPWNKDVFSGEILFTSAENAAFQDTVEFAFPDISDAVNLTAYVNSVLEADVFEDSLKK